jgi:Fe-S cluster biogenesis protein NfuA/nitrite reductase/ring-hydroxylating ferredoxin subunit
LEDAEARERVARVETLLEEVESLPDPGARDKATQMAGALLDLYGEGLARIVGRLAESDGAEGLAAALTEDELVSHLLLLHDLHPVDVETRVVGALDEVRPYLESHGGDVELLEVAEGVVRLRLQGSCSGCPSSAMTLKLAIEDAIHKAAPEVEAVEADGASEAEEEKPKLLQLEVRGPLAAGPDAGSEGGVAWTMAGGLAELGGGTTTVKRVAGERVLFMKLGTTPYAYRSACPGCGQSLESATLRAAELTCPGCGDRYDVQRAGRCLDVPERYLEPIPLLETDAGLVKVAVGAAAA